MRRSIPAIFAFALTLTLPACADMAAPDDGAPTVLVATAGTANALPQYRLDPPVPVPPVERQRTFWTCAAEAEASFAAAITQVAILEARGRFAEADALKAAAIKALHFQLTQCVEIYGAPLLFALPDANGNLVFQPFSVAVYHGYLLRKYGV